jgi:N-acetylglucosamine-6-phosphate deacetylase
VKVIDVHTHGIGGFDTRSASVDAVLRIAEIHGASGVSEIVLSIYSAPIPTMRRQVELVRKAMEEQGPGFGVLGQGSGHASHVTRHDGNIARILGVHLEGPFLNPARCGALDPTSFIEPGEQAFHELVEGFDGIIKMITVAPELRGAPALIRKMTKAGIVVSMGHSEATYSEAERGWRAGARGITHLFNAMRGFNHREPGLAGFGLLKRDIYVEVIADPFHLHAQAIELIFKTKQPERIILVSDTVKEAKTTASVPDITDAAGTVKGGSMTLPESLKRLTAMGFDEAIVVGTITVNPRRYLGL